MTTGIRGDHMARLQSQLKSYGDRLYELERRLGVKQTDLRPKPDDKAIGAQLYGSTTAIANNTNVVLGGLTTSYNSGGVAGTNRITVPVGLGGIWRFDFAIRWNYQFIDPDEFNFHLQRYSSAGTFVAQWGSGDTSHTDGKHLGLQVRMNPGDYMQVNVYHFSGASRDCTPIHFSGFRIGAF